MKMNDRLRFHQELFSCELIFKAVGDYSHLVDISMDWESNGKYVQLVFADPKYDLDTTIREFRNYLIGLVRQDEY